MNPVTFLFEKQLEGWFPQFAVGTAKKKALAWFPGKTPRSSVPAGDLFGITQLAFQRQDVSMGEQACYLHWVGLDIDKLEKPHAAAVLLAGEYGEEVSVRTSCSGNGLHAFFRLDEPILTTWKEAQTIIRAITSPLVERCPLEVDKADRRLFWVAGGRNSWLCRGKKFHTPTEELPTASKVVFNTVVRNDLKAISPAIHGLMSTMVLAGVVPKIGAHIPVHAGTVIDWLRKRGYHVETKSPMKNEPHTNAYLDVSEFEIQLWTFADSRVVWRYQDSAAMLGGFA